jgi:hypothetical protein
MCARKTIPKISRNNDKFKIAMYRDYDIPVYVVNVKANKRFACGQ